MRGAAAIVRAVRAGELDPVEVIQDSLRALEVFADLNAVWLSLGDQALARARAGVGGRLAGVPLLVKDLIEVAGTRTTFGSRIYARHVAATTASCVRALEAEGAIVIAKTACDEFAWGVAGQNPHWGDTHNPRLPGRIASGSSSGNAAALAVGVGALGIGTDTGGSVRLPAAACGVVGMKPELGAVPTDGVYPLAPSFDTIGAMARSVEDCALAWSVWTGEPMPEPRLEGKRVLQLTGPPALGPQDADPGELPVPEADVWPVFYGEAAASHRDTFPARADEYGPTIRAKLERAQRTTPEELAAGRAALEGWRRAAREQPAADVVVSPVLGTATLPSIDTYEEEFRIPFSAYTRVFSFLGWPAIAIGETHLAARDSRTLLEAALAWPG